ERAARVRSPRHRAAFSRSPWTGCRWPPRKPAPLAPAHVARVATSGGGGCFRRAVRVGSAGPPLPWWWGRRALELAAWCCGTAAAELVAGFVLHRRVDSLPLPVEPLPAAVVPRGSLDGRRRRQRPSRRSEQSRRPVPRPSEKHPALLSP